MYHSMNGVQLDLEVAKVDYKFHWHTRQSVCTFLLRMAGQAWNNRGEATTSSASMLVATTVECVEP